MPAKDMRAYMSNYRKYGDRYRETSNRQVKIYQKTLHGRLAQKAGSVNTSSSMRKKHPGRISKDDLLSIWKAQGGVEVYGIIKKEPVCAICKKEELRTFDFRGFIIDHRVPLAYGGKNSIENLHFICEQCNTEKTKKDIEHRRNRSNKYSFEAEGLSLPMNQLTLFSEN